MCLTDIADPLIKSKARLSCWMF